MKQEVIRDKMTIVTNPGNQWVISPSSAPRFPKRPNHGSGVLNPAHASPQLAGTSPPSLGFFLIHFVMRINFKSGPREWRWGREGTAMKRIDAVIQQGSLDE